MDSAGNVAEVLAALSHDLRSPTAAMMLWLRLLRGAPDDESLRERGLAAIEHSAKTLEKLIADVLQLARSEHRQPALSPRLGQLELSVVAAVRAQRAAAVERSLTVRLVTSATPGVVRFDPVKLREAMSRMLAGAIELAAEHTAIDVRCSTYTFSIEVEVREGVSARALASALSSFPPQDHGSLAHIHSATLDLAVARSFVRLHDADLVITANGDTNRVRIAIELPPPQLGARPAPGRLDGVRLLVVDDQPTTLEVMSELLRRAGAETLAATNANEARAMLAEDRVDVIACDLTMPGESGAEFLRERRTRGITTPAIALTGHTSSDEIENAHSAGFDAYVTKPIELDALVNLIGELAAIANP